MKPLDKSYFENPGAEILDEYRDECRDEYGVNLPFKQITYNCFNARVYDNYVICPLHKFATSKGHMRLLTVLQGGAVSNCRNCSDYDGEEIK